MDNILLFLFNAVLTIFCKKEFFLKNSFCHFKIQVYFKMTHNIIKLYEFRNSIGYFDACRNQGQYTYSKEMYDNFSFCDWHSKSYLIVTIPVF